jgi:hypothetical protein
MASPSFVTESREITMKNTTLPALLVVASAVVGCGTHTPAASEYSAKKPAPRAVATYTGFAQPESVVYDTEHDRYLVSSVNGSPTEKDGNGFVSVLTPEGSVQDARWIEGGKNGAKLDSPKGLAIANGALYVADIDVVRIFDLGTGHYNGAISVPGSTFLSDLSSGPHGEVYVTDAGPPRGSLDAVGTEAVYVIEGTTATPLAKGPLGRPTSLAWTDQGLVVAPYGASEIYRLDAKGARSDVTKLPAGGLAGVVQLGDWLYVTSFQASSVFRGKLGGSFEVALADQRSPADLGFDTRRGRLLVPHFDSGDVEAFELE